MGTALSPSSGWRAESSSAASSTIVGRTPSIAAPRRARAIHRSARARAARLSRSACGAVLDLPRQLVEDALLLALGGQRRLGPLVVQLDDGERLDEERRARRALVVDDALDLALRLGPDRDDVAAGAHRDDRLADDPGHRRGAQHRVQALAHAVLGGPEPLADGGELGRGGVEDLAALVDAAADARRELGRGVEQVADLRQVRPAPGLQPRREALGGLERLAPPRAARRASGGRRVRRARARRGCRARRRCSPAPGRRGADRPHRSGPGGARRGSHRPTGSAASASSRDGSKEVWAASCSTIAPNSSARSVPASAAAPAAGQRRETCGSSVIQKRSGRDAQAPA